MATDYKDLLIKLCNSEAKELQVAQGRPPKGIVSTQVIAVIIILARLLSVLQIDDALDEVPK